MPGNMIKKEVSPDKLASSHAKQFYAILSGGTRVERHTKAIDLNSLIRAYGPDKIAIARRTFKARKRASPYLRAMCKRLNQQDPETMDTYTRAMAEHYLELAKAGRPAEYYAAKHQLRGMTNKKGETK